MAAARAGQACSEWGTACGDTCAEFKVGDPENACESSCCDGTSCTPNRGDGKFFCRPSEDGDGDADGALQHILSWPARVEACIEICPPRMLCPHTQAGETGCTHHDHISCPLNAVDLQVMRKVPPL